MCAALIGASLIGGCETTLPGEVVGAYDVVMRLEENTCGRSVVPFADGERYAVELRSDSDERGYWRLTKAPPVLGRYVDAGFSFSYAEAIELGAADAGTRGCIVLREEQLDVVVSDLLPDGGVAARAERSDPGSDAGSALAGTHQVDFRADPGGRCHDVRGPLREFERLPCGARYRLVGQARAPF
jgi:hypothetical protein